MKKEEKNTAATPMGYTSDWDDNNYFISLRKWAYVPTTEKKPPPTESKKGEEE